MTFRPCFRLDHLLGLPLGRLQGGAADDVPRFAHLFGKRAPLRRMHRAVASLRLGSSGVKERRRVIQRNFEAGVGHRAHVICRVERIAASLLAHGSTSCCAGPGAENGAETCAEIVSRGFRRAAPPREALSVPCHSQRGRRGRGRRCNRSDRPVSTSLENAVEVKVYGPFRAEGVDLPTRRGDTDDPLTLSSLGRRRPPGPQSEVQPYPPVYSPR
jgi:hypothetical protein